jgi:hypothetical protein
MEMEQDWFHKYTTAAYLDCGVGNTAEYEAFTKECAEWLNWRFERIESDAGLIRRLVNGDWDGDDFLIVEPRHAIRASNDEAVLRALPAVPSKTPCHWRRNRKPAWQGIQFHQVPESP